MGCAAPSRICLGENKRSLDSASLGMTAFKIEKKSGHLDGIVVGERFVADGSGSFQLVPGEGAAFDGALQRFQQHDREKLAIGEALQPDLAEQPQVFAMLGRATLEGEGDGGSDEVNDKEGKEEN